MPASELQRLLRRLLSSSCVLSLSLTAWGPALSAAELASLPLPALDPSAVSQEDDTLAQRRSNRGGGSGGRSAGSRPTGGNARPAGRPAERPSARPSSRPNLGGGAGAALTRPAPGFDRGNRRPAGGWINNVPETRPRPGQGNRPGRPERPRPPAGNRPDRPDWGDGGRPGRPLPPGIDRPNGNRPGRPGSNRPDWNRPAWNRPDWNRPAWNRPGWKRPNWVINRPVNINTISVRPRWWGPGWVGARPWRYGWYRGASNSWGWWGGSSLAWGITSLASAAIIASAINDSIRDDSPTIDVSDSPYRLVYGSVAAVGDHDVTFSFIFENAAYQASADCKSGLLNGRKPDNPEEAQLINAACQVAYASF